MDSEVDKLRTRLKETEEKLYLSAQHGKQLLEENIKLKDTLKLERNKNTTSNEVLEQDRHSLKIKLDASKKSEEALKEELEFLKDQITTETREKGKICTENTRLNQRIADLESDVNDKEQNEANLRSVIERLESKWNESAAKTYEKECKDALNKTNIYSEETINDLQIENEERKLREITLMQLIEEKETKLEESRKFARTEREKVEMLETELEAKECQLTSYYNILERNREQISDLEAEKQILTMQEVDPNRRGNSLFSEVEDHRQRQEKHLKSLRIKYNDLFKENQENLKRIATLQLKLAAQAASVSTGVSAAHVEHLERQVAKLQAEQRVIVAKQETQAKTFDFVVAQDSGNDKHEYLKAMITRAQSQNEELERECKMLRLKCMSESENGRKIRRQLFETNQKSDGLQAENFRLKVKMEELQRKCGIDADVKTAVLKVIEKVPTEENYDYDKNTNLIENINVCVKKETVTASKQPLPNRVWFSSEVDKNTSTTSETDSVTELNSKKKTIVKPLRMVTVTNEENNECKQQ